MPIQSMHTSSRSIDRFIGRKKCVVSNNNMPAVRHTHNDTLFHTQFYNNMEAPNNCIGGSEQGCVPKGCGPHCGGGAVKVPAPATWYANQGHEASGVATTKLGAGPEV
jgi:hypothetical protein